MVVIAKLAGAAMSHPDDSVADSNYCADLRDAVCYGPALFRLFDCSNH
jgi:hypothetical protein